MNTATRHIPQEWFVDGRKPLDASRIMTHLYQGGAPPYGSTLARAGFQVLVLCAMEFQPESRQFPGLTVLHAPNDDDGDRPISDAEWSMARYTAQQVAAYHRAGQRILVTCMQGRNRSGLVTALALRELTGRSGQECADRVKETRNNALTNPVFYASLCALPKKRIG